MNMLMPHITQKFRDNPEASKNANHSLAVFIKVGAPCCGDTASKELPAQRCPQSSIDRKGYVCASKDNITCTLEPKVPQPMGSN